MFNGVRFALLVRQFILTLKAHHTLGHAETAPCATNGPDDGRLACLLGTLKCMWVIINWVAHVISELADIQPLKLSTFYVQNNVLRQLTNVDEWPAHSVNIYTIFLDNKVTVC